MRTEHGHPLPGGGVKWESLSLLSPALSGVPLQSPNLGLPVWLGLVSPSESVAFNLYLLLCGTLQPNGASLSTLLLSNRNQAFFRVLNAVEKTFLLYFEGLERDTYYLP